MNDDRKFQKHKKIVLFLLQKNLPLWMIENVLGVSPSTARNYVDLLRTSGEWHKKMPSIKDAKPAMLSVYAECDRYAIALEHKASIKKILSEFFEEEKILEAIGYALPVIGFFQKPQFDNVPFGYESLIKELYPKVRITKSLSRMIWKSYLQKIAQAELVLPIQPKQYVWGADHFVHQAIQLYADEMRSNVASVFTDAICGSIDAALSELPLRQKYAIQKYFAIAEVVISPEEKEIPHVRMLNLKDRGVRCLKKKLANELAPVSWQEIQMLKNNYRKAIADIDRKLFVLDQAYQKKLLRGIDVDINEYLLQKIHENDVGVGAYNRLCSEKIIFYWQLVQSSSEDLLKIRGLGKKHLFEIEKDLKEKKLQLNTVFSDTERKFFLLRTIELEKVKKE